MPITRYNSNSRLSAAVVHSNVAYLSGQVPDDRTDDVTGQTGQVLAKIDQLLSDVGSDRSKLLSAQIWLSDISSDFNDFNRVWERWLEGLPTPARATVQSPLASPDVRVEIMVVAAVPTISSNGITLY